APRNKPSDHGGWLGLARHTKLDVARSQPCSARPRWMRLMISLRSPSARSVGSAFSARVHWPTPTWCPLAHTNLVCKPKPFQLPHACDPDRMQVIAFRVALGPQVDDAAA